MRSWETRRGSGSVAYLFDLIRNLASGRWTANCPQMIGKRRRGLP